MKPATNKHFATGQYVAADTLLSRIIDDTQQEANYRKVYAATLAWMQNGEEAIDEELREELEAIALQHPLLGGYGVYVARNLLNREVNDEWSSGLRQMALTKEQTQRKLSLFPNPAKEYVEISFNDRANPEAVIVRDITGRICYTTMNTPIINTSHLNAGLYFIEVILDGEKYNANVVVTK
jgi:hypothetical protein